MEIQEKNLRGIIRDVMSHDLIFEGRALEQEGKKIHDRLKRFENGQIVTVVFETDSVRREEIMRVKEIQTPEPELVAPVIYRFSGCLGEVK